MKGRNTMYIIHELAPDSLETVKQHGLRAQADGAKTHEDIARTDKFLDEHRPERFVTAHIRRATSNYGYFTLHNSVIDIENGVVYTFAQFIDKSTQAVLLIEANPTRCYVSDIDSFDEVKAALQEGDTERATELAENYWQNVVHVSEFQRGDIARPEVLLPYDIPASDITVLKQ